jgi:hypothetical protein
LLSIGVYRRSSVANPPSKMLPGDAKLGSFRRCGTRGGVVVAVAGGEVAWHGALTVARGRPESRLGVAAID